MTKREVTREEGTTEAMEPNTVQPTHPRIHATCTLTYCVAVPVDALPADDGSVRRSPRAHCASVERGSWHVQHCAVALRGRWRCLEPAIARCWRSRKARVPKEVLCGARSHRGCPPHDFRAYRSNHCQVLALPLTHSPEGGSQWCQITPGVPTPRLLGVW